MTSVVPEKSGGDKNEKYLSERLGMFEFAQSSYTKFCSGALESSVQ